MHCFRLEAPLDILIIVIWLLKNAKNLHSKSKVRNPTYVVLISRIIQQIILMSLKCEGKTA